MSARPLNGLAAIDVGNIKPSAQNPRGYLQGIEELAVSIREQGLIQPLVVQRVPGAAHYQIVAGHRRFAAIQRLGWANAPCIIRRDMLPDEELLAMLVENGQRAGLDPVEEAHAIQSLMRGGLSRDQVATKIGRSGGYVASRLMLLSLPPEEQDAVRAGHYSITYANDRVRAERAAQRRAANPVARPVGRPKGAKTKPYFGDTHPFAAAVRARCDHRGSPKVGGVACGPCWEAVIRADALSSQAVAS